jgi:hypothetical protein
MIPLTKIIYHLLILSNTLRSKIKSFFLQIGRSTPPWHRIGAIALSLALVRGDPAEIYTFFSSFRPSH